MGMTSQKPVEKKIFYYKINIALLEINIFFNKHETIRDHY